MPMRSRPCKHGSMDYVCDECQHEAYLIAQCLKKFHSVKINLSTLIGEKIEIIYAEYEGLQREIENRNTINKFLYSFRLRTDSQKIEMNKLKMKINELMQLMQDILPELNKNYELDKNYIESFPPSTLFINDVNALALAFNKKLPNWRRLRDKISLELNIEYSHINNSRPFCSLDWELPLLLKRIVESIEIFESCGDLFKKRFGGITTDESVLDVLDCITNKLK